MSGPAKPHNQGFLDLVNEAKTRVHQMDIGEFQRIRESGDEYALVDVREDSEWAAGHAVGAMHLGKGIIERDIESKIPDKSSKIILYCGGGFRSALAADAVQHMGYNDVISLDGGWRAYTGAGLPVEK